MNIELKIPHEDIQNTLGLEVHLDFGELKVGDYETEDIDDSEVLESLFFIPIQRALQEAEKKLDLDNMTVIDVKDVYLSPLALSYQFSSKVKFDLYVTFEILSHRIISIDTRNQGTYQMY